MKENSLKLDRPKLENFKRNYSKEIQLEGNEILKNLKFSQKKIILEENNNPFEVKNNNPFDETSNSENQQQLLSKVKKIEIDFKEKIKNLDNQKTNLSQQIEETTKTLKIINPKIVSKKLNFLFKENNGIDLNSITSVQKIAFSPSGKYKMIVINEMYKNETWTYLFEDYNQIWASQTIYSSINFANGIFLLQKRKKNKILIKKCDNSEPIEFPKISNSVIKNICKDPEDDYFIMLFDSQINLFKLKNETDIGEKLVIKNTDLGQKSGFFNNVILLRENKILVEINNILFYIEFRKKRFFSKLKFTILKEVGLGINTPVKISVKEDRKKLYVGGNEQTPHQIQVFNVLKNDLEFEEIIQVENYFDYYFCDFYKKFGDKEIYFKNEFWNQGNLEFSVFEWEKNKLKFVEKLKHKLNGKVSHLKVQDDGVMRGVHEGENILNADFEFGI